MTGYSGMLETPECQRLRNVRDCAMSGTAARHWWSLEGRGGAAGVAIVLAGQNSMIPAGPRTAVVRDYGAVHTAEVPAAVRLIREECTIRVKGTVD